MTKSITVQPKTIYGNELYYPKCNEAISMCKLVNTKTLTKRQLTILINELNYTIECITSNKHKYPFII